MSSESDRDMAAVWAVRIEEGALDAAGEQELADWLAADARREAALLRAQAALSYVSRASALLAGREGEVGHDHQPPPAPTRRGMKRWALAGAGLAVGGAMAASVAVVLWLPKVEHLTSVSGQISQVALADGSTVVLSGGTAVDVVLERNRRNLALKSGEALFTVAHDKSRPFVVTTGKVQVRAVGTVFSVRQGEGDIEVKVLEGKVFAWQQGEANAARPLVAGARLVIGADGKVTQSEEFASVQRSLAWTNGGLSLMNDRLQEGVDALNRYNTRKIVIDDADIAGHRITGYFQLRDPERFARAAAMLTGARVIENGDTLHLAARP